MYKIIVFDFYGTLAYQTSHTLKTGGLALFPDTISTLKKLKDMGFQLGILSNSGPSIHDKLRNVGIDQLIDKVYFSAMIGAPKPEDEAFEYILEDLDIRNNEMLYIGDSQFFDIEPCEFLGIPCFKIDRHSKGIVAGVIPTLDRLLEILDSG